MAIRIRIEAESPFFSFIALLVKQKDQKATPNAVREVIVKEEEDEDERKSKRNGLRRGKVSLVMMRGLDAPC